MKILKWLIRFQTDAWVNLLIHQIFNNGIPSSSFSVGLPWFLSGLGRGAAIGDDSISP